MFKIKIYFKKEKETKIMKNNKGFSLVELIIVIAIMAVLVGVLAPTYMQYVEKSKKSNDVSTVDTIINAIEIAAIDPETQSDAWTYLTVEISQSGYTITSDKTDTAMVNACTSIIGTSADVKFKSSQWGGAVKIKATKGNNGKVTFTYDTTGAGTTTFKNYATSITKIS